MRVDACCFRNALRIECGAAAFSCASRKRNRDARVSDKDIELDYDGLTFAALRQVPREVLSITAELGATPGRHHFYMEFLTQAPGVTIPDFLVENYPERMTIVLQNQFDGLEVTDETFSVTLWFKGKPARLTIPFEALTSFADPSVGYGLHFEGEIARAPNGDRDTGEAPAGAAKAGDDAAVDSDADDEADEKSADVVSLDQFRKK